MNNRKWIKSETILVMIILIASLYSFLFCSLKNSWFVDEVYSYGLANSSYCPFLSTTDSWVDASYYQDYVSVQTDPINYGSVLYNQSVDVHPPVFYIILHFISSVCIGSTSKWIGLSINMVASVLGIVLIYEIISLINNHEDKRSWSIKVIAIFFYLVSNGYLSNLLYIRMYCLASFFVIALLYFHLRLIRKKYALDLFVAIGIPLTLYLGSLTHYFFVVYAFAICLIMFLHLFSLEKFLCGGVYTVSCILSMILAYVSFPHVVEQMNRNGGDQGLIHIIRFADIKAFLGIIIQYECNGSRLIFAISLMTLLMVLICGIRDGIAKSKFNIWNVLKGHICFELFFIPPIFYFIVLTKYAEVARYYSLIYPALFLLAIFPIIKILERINNETVYKGIQGIICLFLPICIMNASLENFRYAHFTARQKDELKGLNCVYLNDGWAKYTANVFEFLNYDQVYIASSDNVDWMENDEKIIRGCDNLILYIDDDYDMQNTLDKVLKKGKYSDCKLVFDDHGYSKCYLLSRESLETNYLADTSK